MSDWYEAVGVCDVSPDSAAPLADSVVARLSADGIISSTLDPDAVLGGAGGYRPGPRIPELYNLCENEGPFWTLLTNGLEVCARRWVNELGFTAFDGFTCPECNAHFALDDESVADPFAKAIGAFYEGSDDPPVLCPKCGNERSVRVWRTDPHFGFTNLAFQFWNWPPLNSDSWTVNIPRVIEDTLERKVMVTYGRL